MKFGFYSRLAADSIRKNKRMYVPYILTCIGMVMMTYIINYMEYAEAVRALSGGDTLQTIMNFGVIVILFFATLFLFYTNSFLIKRRKKEFGLYNILGMGKGNLSLILLWETIYIALISILLGLLFGIAFSKLVELGLVNLLEGQITYSLSVPVLAIRMTVFPFLAIFLLLLLNGLRQVWFSSAISLLKSENTGEKPPKANWLAGILGLLFLMAAYYLAVTIKDPISAIGIFVIAVLLVILATYLLMIAGSVLLCRVLQKKKSYYYQPNHFVSVSSMAYRMKRNGAGLASICILATMVLVLLSSTSALFAGGEDVLEKRYPREINGWFHMYENRDVTKKEQELFEYQIADILRRYDAEAKNVLQFHSVSVAGLLTEGGTIIYDQSTFGDFDVNTFSDVHQIYLIPIEDYNEVMKKNETLEENEVLVYAPRNTFAYDNFSFTGHKKYRVKEQIKDCFICPDMAMDIVPALMVIVPDLDKAAQGLTDAEGNDLTYRKWYDCFDTSLEEDSDIAMHEEMNEAFRKLQRNGNNTFDCTIESRAYERKNFYSIYGGLFYLAVILSLVFLFAAVLIIYYKQISEGYEDCGRFEIMQKIGMTKKDIRRSVNSQLLTVFFLPLMGAGLHLVFAFPIMEKLLMLFQMENRPLFLGTTLASFLAFALLYTVVYRVTSNAYYQIVSKGGRD